MKNPKIIFLLILLLSFALGGCLSGDFEAETIAAINPENSIDQAYPQTKIAELIMDHFSTPSGKTKKALFMGLDGTRPDAFVKAGAKSVIGKSEPFFFYFAYAGGEKGTKTQQMTYTAPGWTTILTGRWSIDHKITNNASGRKAPGNPSFLQQLVDKKLAKKVAISAAWEAIVENSTYGDEAVVRFCPDGGYYGGTYETKDPRVQEQIIRWVKEDFDCCFSVFDFTDHTGHLNSFSPQNEPYMNALTKGVSMIGEVIDAVKSRPTYAKEDWLFAISTDHGGIGSNHGGQRLEERTIFVYTNKQIK